MDMMDLEKAILEGKDAASAPVQAMAPGREEQEPLVPADLRIDPIEGGAVARFTAKMNSQLKNWPLYLSSWLLLVASVMVLTNHVFPDGGDAHGAVPKEQLVTQLPAKFALLLWATCLVFRTMKRMD